MIKTAANLKQRMMAVFKGLICHDILSKCDENFGFKFYIFGGKFFDENILDDKACFSRLFAVLSACPVLAINSKTAAYVNSALHPSSVGKSSTGLSSLGCVPGGR